MSVVSVTESWLGEESTDADAGLELKRVLTIIATPGVDGTALDAVAAHADVPKRGEEHPRWDGYFCSNSTVRRAKGPNWYECEATYSTSTTAIDDPSTPTSEAPVFRWESYAWQEALDLDLDGNPIASTAGEPFDPPYQAARSCPLLVMVRNYSTATVTPAWLAQWADTVNSDALTIGGTSVAIGEALIVGQPEAEFVPAAAGVAAYYKVTFRVALRLGGGAGAWQYNPIDQGYRVINFTGATILVVDDAGNPLSQPVLLNGAGTRLASGDPPVYLSYVVRNSIAMSGLGLAVPS